MTEHRKQVHDLEEQTAYLSERVLQQQERQHTAALDELQQSVNQVSEDNVFVEGGGQGAVDPNCIAEKISEFSRLTELLRVTHLEQETLDYFLRYTISSTDLLQLGSVKDEKYVALEKQVEELESETLQQLDGEIERLKLRIAHSSATISREREHAKETCLETATVIDECWELIDELESLTKDKGEQTNLQGPGTAPHPVEETYTAWEDVVQGQQALQQTEQQLQVLEKTRDSLERAVENRHNITDSDAQVVEACTTLDLLAQLWRTRFLHKGVSNLEVYPQTAKFQFECKDVTIAVSFDSTGITAVRLYSTGRHGIEPASLALQQRDVEHAVCGDSDFYRAIETIVGMIK